MSLLADLYGYLSGLTTITDEFGSPPRVYLQAAPTQGAYPYATFSRIDVEHEHIMNQGAAGMARAIIQFDVKDENPVALVDAREALRIAMDGYADGVINGVGTTDVKLIELLDERDSIIPPPRKDQRAVHTSALDFELTYLETAPTFPAT